jgi:tetratricopeptide (TPR) repeat protein
LAAVYEGGCCEVVEKLYPLLSFVSICNNLPAMKIAVFSALLLVSSLLFAQTPTAAPQVSPQIKQVQQLNSEGKQDEALAVLKSMLASEPNNYEANLNAGIVLDLKGNYTQARTYLHQALEIAPADRRVQALRTTAVSYAFQCDMPRVLDFEQQAYQAQLQEGKPLDAAATANELARIYLECGDTEGAAQWYQTGYTTAMHAPNLSDADKDLWEFRYQSAKTRIAARKGHTVEADADLKTVKAIVDAGKLPTNQQVFYPYLAGYVAFYGGDYKTAADELQKADQKDPFILALLAQAYEKLGKTSDANSLYRQILTINSHNPTNAFARPLAKKKLGISS